MLPLMILLLCLWGALGNPWPDRNAREVEKYKKAMAQLQEEREARLRGEKEPEPEDDGIID